MTEPNSTWDGVERRGQGIQVPMVPLANTGAIPVAVLQYLDARLAAHVARIEDLLSEHTVEEMQRYKEIVQSIKATAEASESRQTHMLEQLETLTHRSESVEAAFTVDDQGKPDYAGHKHEHQAKKLFNAWLDGTKRSVGSKLLEWGAVVFVAYLVLKVAPSLLAPVMSAGVVGG